MVVLIDTREQLPLYPGPKVTLCVGDYTTKLLKDVFHVERKSPADLYGTLLRGHARFRREIFRAEEKQIKLVIYVECSAKDFYNKRFPGAKFCKFPAETIKKCIATMTVKYSLEFNWSRNRTHCKTLIHKRLLYEERNYKGTGRKNAKSNRVVK